MLTETPEVSGTDARTIAHAIEPAERLIKALMESARQALRGRSEPIDPSPFLKHPWTALAIRAAQSHAPLAALERVRTAWLQHLSSTNSANRRIGQRLVRRLDDAKRRVLFAHLEDAQCGGPESLAASAGISESAAIAQVTAALGPPDTWLRQYGHFSSNRPARMVLIPTWQCELRCTYCWIPKQDGRSMTADVVDRSLDMLLSTDHEHVNLQFFGGEALLEYEIVQYAIEQSWQRTAALGKSIDYVLSSNGWSLDEDRIAWLARYPVKLELSLDGGPDVQAQFRRSNIAGQDSYTNSIAARAEAIRASGLAHEVIMVVQPATLGRLRESFFHIMDLGFDRVQINFALGEIWSQSRKQQFAEQLHDIGLELKRRWSQGQPGTLVNLDHPPMPVRLNAEIHIDYDGTVYGSNGFLNETKDKHRFVLGHLDDLRIFDRYWMDAPSNSYLLEWTYPQKITRNNVAMGKIMASFVRWMQAGSE